MGVLMTGCYFVSAYVGGRFGVALTACPCPRVFGAWCAGDFAVQNCANGAAKIDGECADWEAVFPSTAAQGNNAEIGCRYILQLTDVLATPTYRVPCLL